MAEESPDTSYMKGLLHSVGKRIAERRAQDAADAAVAWMSYPQAIREVLPILFGRDWVKLASEQERAVLEIGKTHRDWPRFSQIHREREEQIARAERWLLIKGLVEERHGDRFVQTTRLQDALADETMADRDPIRAGGSQSQGAAAPSNPNSEQEPAYTGTAGRPTSWENLVEPECRRRYAAGERHPGRAGQSRAEWMRTLKAWLKSNHPSAPQPKPKTFTNHLSNLLRELERQKKPRSRPKPAKNTAQNHRPK
jgi:hypothetical protein